MIKSKNPEPVLVITTISDLHGQLEPTYSWAADGTVQERGGISRIAAQVKALRERYPEKMLLFGSGDLFIEDFNKGKYFLAFGGEVVASFLNTLSIDASAIGNHEFDFGTKALDSALRACSFPFIATNLKQSDLSYPVPKKLIINKNGYRLGILGVMLSDMKILPTLQWFKQEKTKTGHDPLAFESDLYGCMQAAVDDLKTRDQVDFVMVLSHIGIEEDKKLAERVHGIDLICGGHTHTSTPKGCEVVVQKSDSTITVISHPGDRGRSLGMVKLWPKEGGRLIFECDVLAMDDRVTSDQQVEDKLQAYKRQLPSSPVVATTTCPIDTTKDAVRKQENGFANFVADVIRDHFGAEIVLINASCIRGEEILPAGKLTEDDIDNFFPLKNDLLIRLQATEKQIRQALELGAADLEGNSRNLVHVSGLRYTIDPSKPAFVPEINEAGFAIGSKRDGSRIVSVEVEQQDGAWVPLDDNRAYNVVINSMMIDEAFYLAQFYMFKVIKDMHHSGLTEKGVLLQYFKDHPIISPNTMGCLKIFKHL